MSLTSHIAKFQSIIMNITRCCKHTGCTPPTELELVLLLIGSITSTNPTLTAHIVMVTSNLTGLGMRFEDTATNLMLANPTGSVEYKPGGNRREMVHLFLLLLQVEEVLLLIFFGILLRNSGN